MEFVVHNGDSFKTNPGHPPILRSSPTITRGKKNQFIRTRTGLPTRMQSSGQIITFHQPRFPWNKGISLPQLSFGVRSCEVAIIWPESSKTLERQWITNASFFGFPLIQMKRIDPLWSRPQLMPPITKESRHPGSDDCIPGQVPIDAIEWTVGIDLFCVFFCMEPGVMCFFWLEKQVNK